MSKEFKSLKVKEIRKMLVEKGFPEEEVNNIKGKASLVEMYKKTLETENEILNDKEVTSQDEIDMYTKAMGGEVVEETNDDQEIYQEEIHGSEDWVDYVMQQFTSSETDEKGNPKIAGLRRLAGTLLGDIIFSGPISLWPAVDSEKPGRAAAIVEVRIAWKGAYDDIRVFRGCAGAWWNKNIGNVDEEFAVFPEAVAETRAEARALKKALGLPMVSADETMQKDSKEMLNNYRESQEDKWSNDGISHAQVCAIQTMCKRLKIDYNKFINSGEKEYEDIKHVPKAIAVKMLQKLNQYQRSELEVSSNILEENDNETTS